MNIYDMPGTFKVFIYMVLRMGKYSTYEMGTVFISTLQIVQMKILRYKEFKSY